MPLSDREVAKTGTPITISGHKVFYLDLVPSKNVDTFYKRIVGAVVRHGDHTFLINAGLPEVVTHHKHTFESFAKSLEFASAKDLDRWFPASQPLQQGGFQTSAVALVPDGPRLWSFQLFENAQGKQENSQHEVFEELIRSISPLQGNAKAGIQWADPKDWEREGPANQPIIYSLQSRTAAAQLMIYVVADAADVDRLPLVNLWRIQSGLPAWQREQMAKASRKLQIAGRTVALFNFETIAAIAGSEDPPSQPPESELTYRVPEGWTAGKASLFRKASFLIQEGDKQADISVSVLPVAAKSLLNNVNRWRAQVQLGPLDEAAIRESVKKVAVAGKTGQYIDIPGTNGNRILAVIAERDEGIWFFKMMGDEQLVGKQKDAFESFVKSVRFDAALPKR